MHVNIKVACSLQWGRVKRDYIQWNLRLRCDVISPTWSGDMYSLVVWPRLIICLLFFLNRCDAVFAEEAARQQTAPNGREGGRIRDRKRRLEAVYWRDRHVWPAGRSDVCEEEKKGEKPRETVTLSFTCTVFLFPTLPFPRVCEREPFFMTRRHKLGDNMPLVDLYCGIFCFVYGCRPRFFTHLFFPPHIRRSLLWRMIKPNYCGPNGIIRALNKFNWS